MNINIIPHLEVNGTEWLPSRRRGRRLSWTKKAILHFISPKCVFVHVQGCVTWRAANTAGSWAECKDSNQTIKNHSAAVRPTFSPWCCVSSFICISTPCKCQHLASYVWDVRMHGENSLKTSHFGTWIQSRSSRRQLSMQTVTNWSAAVKMQWESQTRECGSLTPSTKVGVNCFAPRSTNVMEHKWEASSGEHLSAAETAETGRQPPQKYLRLCPSRPAEPKTEPRQRRRHRTGWIICGEKLLILLSRPIWNIKGCTYFWWQITISANYLLTLMMCCSH